MKGFFKFVLFVTLLGGLVIVLLGLGGLLYVRTPAAKLDWNRGDRSGSGPVYWKPFSDRYIAEIDLGADLYVWAGIDRDSQFVDSPIAPSRLGGVFLIPHGTIELPDQDRDERTGDWQAAFSRSMVTFDDGTYRCSVQF